MSSTPKVKKYRRPATADGSTTTPSSFGGYFSSSTRHHHLPDTTGDGLTRGLSATFKPMLVTANFSLPTPPTPSMQHHIPSSSPSSRPSWGFVSRSSPSSTSRLSRPRESSVPPPISRSRSAQHHHQSQPQPVPFSGSYSSLAAGTSTSSLAGAPSSAAASTTSITQLPLPPPRQQYFVEKRGKRHHAYGKKVPYTLSYERDVTDHHILDEEWNLECRNGITYAIFDTPPERVLDLGCGTGSWILTAAKEWKDTQFIGFDLVPIQPNLDLLDPDVAPPTVPPSSSTFSHSSPIPPPSLQQQQQQQHPIPTSSSSSPQPPPPVPPLPPLPLQSNTSNAGPTQEPSRGRSASTNTQPSLISVASSSKGSGASGSASGGGRKPRPTSLSLEALVAANVSATAAAIGIGDEEGKDKAESDDEAVESPQHPTLRLKERVRWVHGDFLETLPFPDGYFDFVRARRIARGVPEHMWDHVYSELARVLKPGGTFEHFECNLTFPGGEFHTAFPGSPPTSDASQNSGGRRSFVGKLRRPRTSATAFEAATYGTVPPSPHRLRHQQSAPFSSLSSAFSQQGESVPKRDGGVSVAPAMSKDPRDHSILEAIYTSMHEARFINVTPISIIQNYLVLHFKDLKTHPPLTLFAPKRAVGDDHWPQLKEGEYTPTTRMITAIELNAWAARAMGLKPTLPPSVQPQNLAMQSRSFELSRKQGSSVASSAASTTTASSGTGGGSKTLESLVAAGPQYPAVPRLYKVEDFLGTDRSRSIPRVNMATIPGLKGHTIKSMNGLPNRTFQYDVGYSALQLSMNVAEVLGCAEDMWAYVRQEDPFAERGCFDDLLKRYAADMRNRIAMRELVEERLHWEGRAKSDSPALKDFETQLQMALAGEAAEGTVATVSTDGTAAGRRPSNSFLRDPMGVEGVETSNSYVNGKMVARTFKAWCMVTPS